MGLNATRPADNNKGSTELIDRHDLGGVTVAPLGEGVLQGQTRSQGEAGWDGGTVTS